MGSWSIKKTTDFTGLSINGDTGNINNDPIYIISKNEPIFKNKALQYFPGVS
jgi:hypothetical protein